MNFVSAKLGLIFLLFVLSLQLNLRADTYDPSASVFLFQKQMAKRGNAESQYKLGLMYETGSGVNNSSALATSWYKKAAHQNYKPASNRLTYLEIKKNGFQNTHEKWLKELKNEARFNDGEALFLLGQMYSEGTGVNKSLTRSLEYLRKAAGGNIPGSESEIARVEAELTLLQKQYITEKEKNNITPVVIKPASNTIKTRPKSIKPKATVSLKNTTKKTVHSSAKNRVTSTPKNSLHKKTAQKSITKKNTTQKSTFNKKTNKKPTQGPIQKHSNIAQSDTSKKAPIKTHPAKPAPVVEQHPMDSICGGRNRFSRGCR